MRRTGTGASIVDRSIRIAKIEKQEGKYKIIDLNEMPLERNIFEEDVKPKPKTLSNFFKKLFLATNALVSIPDKYVTVMLKDFPPLRKADIFKIIEQEIKDYKVFSQGNVALGLSIIDKNKEKNRVLWAGTSENNALRVVKFFRNISIRVKGILPNDLAIVEAMNEIFNINKAAILSVDYDTTKLIVFEGKSIRSSFRQDTGSKNILKDGPALSDWIANIVASISFATAEGGVGINEIFVAAHNKEITDKVLKILRKRLSLDFKDLSFSEQANLEKGEYTSLDLVNYIKPIGLALLSIDNKNNPLYCDISKHIFYERYSSKVKIATALSIFFIFNLLFIILYLYSGRSIRSIDNSLSLTGERYNEVIKISALYDETVKKIDNLKTDTDYYTSAITEAEKNKSAYELLYNLKNSTPDGVIIVSLSSSIPGEVVISGRAKVFSSVFQYEENLSKLSVIENPTVNFVNKNANEINFQIKANVRVRE